MRLLLGIPLILMLTLSLLMVGCGESSEDKGLKDYLTKVQPLIEEAAEIQRGLFDIAKDAGPFGVKNPGQALLNYSEKLDNLLTRLKAVEYPESALKLREHTIDMVQYFKKMVDEMSAYIDSGDRSHIDGAESYATFADESRLLAMDEWDRLSGMTGQKAGFRIGQVFLGLLALGVVVAIASFVLQLTLGTGGLIIVGIMGGIAAIVEKVRGGKPRSS